MGAWTWMSPSSFKLMYQNFNWRFWTDDGMRKQTADGESDPHYLEMLKVIVCIQHTLLISYRRDSTLTLQTAGILWPLWCLLLLRLWLYTWLIRLCHGKHSAVLNSAMFLIAVFQVGVLDINPSGDSHYPFLRGYICHHWIDFHNPTVCSGNWLVLEGYIAT